MSSQTRTFKLFLGILILGSLGSLLGGPSGFRSLGASVAIDSTWFDPGWGFRMKITASSVMTQGGPFRDFPLVVRLGNAQSAVFGHSKTDGSDLVVTKGDGVTPLSREIVSFDPVKRFAEIWIRADTLSSTRRTFYLYYGNALASLPASDGSAWAPEYLGVYHFNDDPGGGIQTDSGPNHHDVFAGQDAQFTSSDTIQGPVGQAWRFNGTTHWIDGDGLSSSDSSFTISAWFACWNQFRPGDADFAFSVEEGFWHLSAKRNYQQRVPDALGNNGFFTWTPDPIDTLLHQYIWCLDGKADTIRFYYDGVEQTPLVLYSPSGQRIYTGFHLGGNIGIASPLFGSNNHSDLMEGIVDEFRVRVGVVTPAWAASEFRNQKSNLFLTFGPEEMFGVVPIRLLAFTALWDGDEAAIRWEIAEGAEAGGFRLYRETPGGGRVLVTSVLPGAENAYRILDRDAPSTGATYRLAWTDREGVTSWFGPTALGARTDPRLILSPNHPNPFRTGTTIVFTVDQPGEVRLRVFDLGGREVARPWTGWLAAGPHEVPWTGTGFRGESLGPGMYLLQLETSSGARARKMIKTS